MTITEFSMLIIALSGVSIAIVAFVTVSRLVPVLRETRHLLRSARETMVRLDRVAYDLEHVSRDARQLETRLSRVAGGLMDQVEPSIHGLSAILAGARTGLSALFSRGSENGAGHHTNHRSRAGRPVVAPPAPVPTDYQEGSTPS